jgi:hypothetical protein
MEQVMASSQPNHGGPMIDTAFGQLEQLNEQMATAMRKAASLSLHLYEQAVEKAIELELELELELARRSEQEWLKAQAEITRDLTTSYTNAARGLLK